MEEDYQRTSMPRKYSRKTISFIVGKTLFLEDSAKLFKPSLHGLFKFIKGFMKETNIVKSSFVNKAYSLFHEYILKEAMKKGIAYVQLS